MFDLRGLSAEDILQQLVNLREKDSDLRFIMGELCAYAMGMGINVGRISSEINCTKGYVHQMVKVYRAFPTEESRLSYPTLPYMCFKLAAYTDQPEYWMDQAVDNEWSSREMAKAINGEVVKDELREADRVYGRVERVIEAGGVGARYLFDHLTAYLRTISLD